LDDAAQGVEVVTVVDERVNVDVAGDDGEPLRGRAVAVDEAVAVAALPAAADDDDADPIVRLPQSMPKSVAVVGDSLTLAAETEIENALSQLGLDVLVVDGVESRRMVRGGSALLPGVDAIDGVLDAGLEPELWIIALGTNDVGSGSSPDSFHDDVAAVLASVPPGAPVVWIDLWIRDRSAAVAEANRALRSIAALRPATRVGDWFSHGDDPGIITDDGIHLTAAGERLFAASMASAVDSMFKR
jgi:lysophospholipase L1-like esterase